MNFTPSMGGYINVDTEIVDFTDPSVLYVKDIDREEPVAVRYKIDRESGFLKKEDKVSGQILHLTENSLAISNILGVSKYVPLLETKTDLNHEEVLSLLVNSHWRYSYKQNVVINFTKQQFIDNNGDIDDEDIDDQNKGIVRVYFKAKIEKIAYPWILEKYKGGFLLKLYNNKRRPTTFCLNSITKTQIKSTVWDGGTPVEVVFNLQ